MRQYAAALDGVTAHNIGAGANRSGHCQRAGRRLSRVSAVQDRRARDTAHPPEHPGKLPRGARRQAGVPTDRERRAGHAADPPAHAAHRQREGRDAIRAAQLPVHGPRHVSWAFKEGRVPDDPTLGVTREKIKTTGYKTWSEAADRALRDGSPVGSKARLAFALLLYTGQRRGDVVRMGARYSRRPL